MQKKRSKERGGHYCPANIVLDYAFEGGEAREGGNNLSWGRCVVKSKEVGQACWRTQDSRVSGTSELYNNELAGESAGQTVTHKGGKSRDSESCMTSNERKVPIEKGRLLIFGN
jgi:hypothetical protein